MNESPPAILPLILWPSVVTLLVSVARLVAEVQGWTTTASGGRFAWLGISWLAFVFGGWFGWRLGRAGSMPSVPRAWLWPLLAFLLIAGTAAWRFRQIDMKDSTPAAMPPLRTAVWIIIGVAVPMALLQFMVWRRLAATMLLYGSLARVTVIGLTWLAKDRGWDTHYTKFGPGGVEVDMADTMASATTAQLGFWVPFTIVAGTLVGAIVGGRRR